MCDDCAVERGRVTPRHFSEKKGQVRAEVKEARRKLGKAGIQQGSSFKNPKNGPLTFVIHPFMPPLLLTLALTFITSPFPLILSYLVLFVFCMSAKAHRQPHGHC